MDQGEVQFVDQIAVTVLVQGWQYHLQGEDDQDCHHLQHRSVLPYENETSSKLVPSRVLGNYVLFHMLIISALSLLDEEMKQGLYIDYKL